ncbi:MULTISPECIES: NVEALA domain-containing protein [Bacteroides]|jgi:hypothetical protein|uniref:NVEALA protein n=1 Tax=Bacteroides intestinalis TaxID=329854 RepID=A0AAQ0RS79_9BACE|nr:MULTISPECIES: NVEALA domain-containing protein [Bacteroides]QDO67722.1 hypothetical protein DXK01_001720 [Bacteroides intestinalis]RGT50579.1 hypothetical protein DWX27_13480 [Bacteroides intestinalis]RGX84035.1 hypothetical protein DXA61_15725 [Bacteroides intestinalis]RHI00797.1 hypothetical protein DW182_20905 [Bacteroides sp. AM16-24]UCB35953.1 NVEALA domain-containing protein [Bacteroides intestinalis]
MKKFLKYAFVAALVTVAGYGVYASQKSDAMSDLMLANVEALARYEVNPDCPNGCTSSLNSYCHCFKIYRDMREVHWQ